MGGSLYLCLCTELTRHCPVERKRTTWLRLSINQILRAKFLEHVSSTLGQVVDAKSPKQERGHRTGPCLEVADRVVLSNSRDQRRNTLKSSPPQHAQANPIAKQRSAVARRSDVQETPCATRKLTQRRVPPPGRPDPRDRFPVEDQCAVKFRTVTESIQFDPLAPARAANLPRARTAFKQKAEPAAGSLKTGNGNRQAEKLDLQGRLVYRHL